MLNVLQCVLALCGVNDLLATRPFTAWWAPCGLIFTCATPARRLLFSFASRMPAAAPPLSSSAASRRDGPARRLGATTRGSPAGGVAGARRGAARPQATCGRQARVLLALLLH